MNVKDIKKQIKIAHEAVNGENEPYKLESFKIILESLLESELEQNEMHSLASMSSQTSQIHETKGELIQPSNIDGLFDQLANSCNLNSNELKDVIILKGKKLKITASLPGKENLQRVVGTLCVLLANQKLFNKDESPGTEILDVLKTAGIYDKHGHLAENLDTYRKLFRITGTKSGKIYGISSSNGIKITQKIFEMLSKGTSAPEIIKLLKSFKKNS